MAIKYWTGGAGTEVWATAGNWAGGSAAGDGDTVVCDKNSLRGISTFPAWSSVNIVKFVATPGFAFSLGAVGNPFNPDNGCDEFIWEATGAASEAHVDTAIDKFVVDTPVQHGMGVVFHDSASAGTVGQGLVARGMVTLAADFIFSDTSLIVVGTGATLVIPDGVTMGTGNQIVQTGGIVRTAENLVGIEIMGGQLQLQAAATIAALTLRGPSALATLEGTGTITTAKVYEGMLDAHSHDVARTITNLYGSAPGIVKLGQSTVLTNGAIGIVPQYPYGIAVNKV